MGDRIERVDGQEKTVEIRPGARKTAEILPNRIKCERRQRVASGFPLEVRAIEEAFS